MTIVSMITSLQILVDQTQLAMVVVHTFCNMLHFFNLYLFWFLECQCHKEGTLVCDVMTGDCYCKEGYTGELCNKCSEGYHDSIQTPSAPTCTGMKNHKYLSPDDILDHHQVW